MDFGLGLIPDLLRGKKFDEALVTNAKQGAMAGLAMFGIPAMGAGAASPAAGSYAADAAGTSAGFGGADAMTIAPKGASPSMFKGLLDTASTVGQAAQGAGAVQGLLGGGQPMQASPPPQTGGSDGLAQLYATLQQGAQQSAQMDAQNRAKQQELLKRFGGGYGAA